MKEQLQTVKLADEGLTCVFETTDIVGGTEVKGKDTRERNYTAHPDLLNCLDPLRAALLRNTGAAHALEQAGVKGKKLKEVLAAMAGSMRVSSVQKMGNGNFKVTGAFTYQNPCGCHVILTPEDEVNALVVWEMLEVEVTEYLGGKSNQLTLEVA